MAAGVVHLACGVLFVKLGGRAFACVACIVQCVQSLMLSLYSLVVPPLWRQQRRPRPCLLHATCLSSCVEWSVCVGANASGPRENKGCVA